MKVKELYKKYKDYCIILYGENRYYSLKECIKKVTPFNYIHTINPKEINELQVLEIIVDEYEFETIDFDVKLQYKGRTKYKGDVYALVERG